MKLGALFEAVRPYFEGRVEHEAALRSVYGAAGQGDGGVDGERLAIYARFCRAHRFEVLALFEETRAAVVALPPAGSRAGTPSEAAWEQLVEDYFLAHPMRHFELFENGAEFPAWLAVEAPARDLPPWLAELADLEWWRWRVEMAPDGEDEGEGSVPGRLRIASSVELRLYTHDLGAWLDAKEDRPAAPEPAQQMVLFWRDRDLEGRFEAASPVELAVLKMVAEGLAPEALASATGLTLQTIDSTIDDLRGAGILAGTGD